MEEEIKNEIGNQEILAQGSISLLLNSYDDLFSDFDPRPYGQRSLSYDFLAEAKRATTDKEGVFELRFLVPKAKRRPESETVIRLRLREHFKRHHDMLVREVQQTKRKGWLMAFCGILMMLVVSYLFTLDKAPFFIHMLIVILEPAGWFTAWTGLDEVFYTARINKPDIEFYRKMVHSTISFISY